MIELKDTHIVYLPNEENSGWNKKIMPGYPEELDPYSINIPRETQMIIDQLLEYKHEVEDLLGIATGSSGPREEEIIGVTQDQTDETGRGNILIADITYAVLRGNSQIPVLPQGVWRGNQIFNFYIYPNGVGIHRIINKKWWDGGMITLLVESQRFMRKSDISRLQFIRSHLNL